MDVPKATSKMPLFSETSAAPAQDAKKEINITAKMQFLNIGTSFNLAQKKRRILCVLSPHPPLHGIMYEDVRPRKHHLQLSRAGLLTSVPSPSRLPERRSVAENMRICHGYSGGAARDFHPFPCASGASI
jgi:hypothetical protein